MQVFLYYFRSILLFINTLIASAYIELTLFIISRTGCPRIRIGGAAVRDSTSIAFSESKAALTPLASPERRGEGTGGKVHSAYSRIER